MKPLNLNKDSCNPISSNCVVWQGPDIECINLCKGDSVTEVVYKLATELCELLETFNVDNYDISCFNLLECAPEDFAALIQLLINKVCECCGLTPTPIPGTSTVGCPDCEVTICEAFYYQNPQGDTLTSMQLDDYVAAIGNRVCQIIGQIDTINASLANHEERIEILETAPAPILLLPKMTPECVLPATPTDIDTVLIALEEQFCLLRAATGDPSQIYAAIIKQCAGLNSSPQLSGSGNMQDIIGWEAATANGADAMSNIWLTICDLRASIQNIQATCCDSGCDGIVFAMTAALTSPTQLQLNFTGTVPGNFADCVAGSDIVLTDTQGGTMTVSLNIISNYLNVPSGFIVDLTGAPVDGNLSINAVSTLCALDSGTGTTCQSVASATAAAQINCPLLVLSPGLDTILYQFNYFGTIPASAEIELWNTAQTAILQVQTVALTVNGQAVANSFAGLDNGTVYWIRIVIDKTTECAMTSATTLEQVCLPPTNGGIVELNPPA